MKRYVISQLKTLDNGDATMYITVYGNKMGTSIVNNISENRCDLDDNKLEAVYNNPIKSERSAKILRTKLSKAYTWSNNIIDFPDNITYDQFKSFVQWGVRD